MPFFGGTGIGLILRTERLHTADALYLGHRDAKEEAAEQRRPDGVRSPAHPAAAGIRRDAANPAPKITIHRTTGKTIQRSTPPSPSRSKTARSARNV